ncbi:hypothetical protein Nmel_015937 [Mimus melanotis]
MFGGIVMVTSLAKQMAPLGDDDDDDDGHPDSSGHFESAVGSESPTQGMRKPPIPGEPGTLPAPGRASPGTCCCSRFETALRSRACRLRDSSCPPSPAAEGLEEWVKLLQPPHPLLPSPPPLSQERHKPTLCKLLLPSLAFSQLDAPHHHPETLGKMPGLMNWATLSQLPLIASEVTSCVSGYAFGMTALLTYHNPDPQALEGKF